MTRLYGNKDLAEALGWTAQKTHIYNKRGKFEKPEFVIGERPAWTIEQVERIVKKIKGYLIEETQPAPMSNGLQSIDELDDFDDINNFTFDFKREESEVVEEDENPLDDFLASMNK